jgi:transcriptional regulator with XRE-family HTH domain
MTQERSWPAELTHATGRAIRRYREKRRMSAEQLAESISTLGLRYTRTQVSNLESGRRESITVGEVLAFAAVLEVPPALLLFPIGTDNPVTILPGQMTNPWMAYQCFIGEYVLSRAVAGPGASSAERQLLGDTPMWIPKLPDRDNPIAIYRQHDNALMAYLITRDHDPRHELTERHLTMLAAARIEMHRHRWKLPEIPPDVADAIVEPLLAWGYKQEDSGELIEVRIVQDLAPAVDHIGHPAAEDSQ